MRARSFIAMAVLAGSWWATEAVAQNEITGGDVRYVLDGKYGLTSEGYAEYRKCIADIPFGGTMKEYKAGLEVCKKKAKETAFPIATSSSIPETEKPADASQLPLDSVVKDRAWQQQIYKK